MFTSLSHSLLAIQITLFLLVLSPLPIKYKTAFISSKPFIHATTGLLLMVLFSFLDSTIKLRNSSEFFYYYSERNCILSGISLFLLIIFKRLIRLFEDLSLEKQKVHLLEKQITNQKDFVDQIIKENENLKKKIEDENNKVTKLKNIIKENELLVKQAKNNQEEYFKLLDKYNELRYSRESKKKI
ncbi:Endoplasmic reticulum transmembrane protein YET-like [Dictyocoela muelleri]|nr:Endoplasmic reticulum transmembrane protein YET-like [Dictyocoela muelleri]